MAVSTWGFAVDGVGGGGGGGAPPEGADRIVSGGGGRGGGGVGAAQKVEGWAGCAGGGCDAGGVGSWAPRKDANGGGGGGGGGGGTFQKAATSMQRYTDNYKLHGVEKTDRGDIGASVTCLRTGSIGDGVSALTATAAMSVGDTRRLLNRSSWQL